MITPEDNSVLYHMVSQESIVYQLADFLLKYSIQYLVIANLDTGEKCHTMIRIFNDHREALSQFVLSNQLISIRVIGDNEATDIFTIE